MKIKFTLALGFSIIFLPLWLAASHPEAVRFLEDTKIMLHDLGFTIISGQTGVMEVDESTTLATTLYKGNEYAFYIGGGSNVSDIGIYIFDEDGIQIASNSGLKDVEVLKLTVKHTGTFFIKIKLYETADGSMAHYSYSSGYRPAGK